VTSTRSSSVALRLIKHRRPDAILARIGLDGVSTMIDDLLRSHPDIPLVVIVEATGDWAPPEHSTASATLRAPYSSKQLLATLGRLVQTPVTDRS